VEKEDNNDLFADMKWMISKSSGVIQLEELIPLDELYFQSHQAGSIGELWKKHHTALADFIHQYDCSDIFEIGGGHGILANEYHKLKDTPWTILEPNPAPSTITKAKYINGFFNESFKYNNSFDTVVHSHLFEHVYDPDVFMSQLSNFIPTDKFMFFSIPHLEIMMERKYTNSINFEHTVYLTEPYVKYLLDKHGFRIVQKNYFMEDHSIFYAVVRDDSVKPTNLPVNLYEKNKTAYINYVNFHKDLITLLNQNIEENTYIFGAHIFTQYLIAFGLDLTKIKGVLDNDPFKHGKRLYGSPLIVSSPKILKDVINPTVILRAGIYNKEVKKDILENINSNTKFI